MDYPDATMGAPHGSRTGSRWLFNSSPSTPKARKTRLACDDAAAGQLAKSSSCQCFALRTSDKMSKPASSTLARNTHIPFPSTVMSSRSVIFQGPKRPCRCQWGAASGAVGVVPSVCVPVGPKRPDQARCLERWRDHSKGVHPNPIRRTDWTNRVSMLRLG